MNSKQTKGKNHYCTLFVCEICKQKICDCYFHVHCTRHFVSRFLEKNYENKYDTNKCRNIKLFNVSHCNIYDDLNINDAGPNIPNRQSIDTNYIYKIDRYQLGNMKLQIILSFSMDEHNIYCLICREIVKNSLSTIYDHLRRSEHNNCFQRMKSEHLKFILFPMVLSDLQLALEFMEATSHSYVKCWACNIDISDINDTLERHIDNISHKKNCEIMAKNSGELFKSIEKSMFRDWYNVTHYLCTICGETSFSENQFLGHISTKDKRHFGCINDNKYIYDFCPTCATLWFGPRHAIARHCENKIHKYLLKHHFYNISEIPNEAKKLLTAPEFICDDILKEINRNITNNDSITNILINDLRELIKTKFPLVEIYPFGSWNVGLVFEKNAIQVYADCDNLNSKCYNNTTSFVNIHKNIETIRKLLDINSALWRVDAIITKHNGIPIIKIYHRPTNIQCDISFIEICAAEYAITIQEYIKLYPVCKKLIIFIEKWMKECNLSQSDGFTSSAIIWMVIYYLQNEHILPSVSAILKLLQSNKIQVSKIPKVDCDKFSLVHLIKGFFEMYSKFDYRYEIICPLVGYSIKKYHYNISHFASRVKNIMACIGINPENQEFNTLSAICIQDPFEFGNNLTNNTKKYILNQLRIFCSISAQML